MGGWLWQTHCYEPHDQTLVFFFSIHTWVLSAIGKNSTIATNRQGNLDRFRRCLVFSSCLISQVNTLLHQRYSVCLIISGTPKTFKWSLISARGYYLSASFQVGRMCSLRHTVRIGPCIKPAWHFCNSIYFLPWSLLDNPLSKQLTIDTLWK